MHAVALPEATNEVFCVHVLDRANMSANAVDLAEMVSRLTRTPLRAQRGQHHLALTYLIPGLDDTLTSTTRRSGTRSLAHRTLTLATASYVAVAPTSTSLTLAAVGRDKAAALERPDEAEREAALQQVMSYTPRTPLGRRLCALRARIISSGEPLLSREDIDRTIAESRGGYDEA
jgi:hypothetical protein